MTNDLAKAHVYSNGDEAQAEAALWEGAAEILDHADGYIIKLTLRGGTYYIGG